MAGMVGEFGQAEARQSRSGLRGLLPEPSQARPHRSKRRPGQARGPCPLAKRKSAIDTRGCVLQDFRSKPATKVVAPFPANPDRCSVDSNRSASGSYLCLERMFWLLSDILRNSKKKPDSLQLSIGIPSGFQQRTG